MNCWHGKGFYIYHPSPPPLKGKSFRCHGDNEDADAMLHMTKSVSLQWLVTSRSGLSLCVSLLPLSAAADISIPRLKAIIDLSNESTAPKIDHREPKNLEAVKVSTIIPKRNASD